MVAKRQKVMMEIFRGNTDAQINRVTGCSRPFIKKIRNQLMNGENVFEMTSKLGAPRKVTDELEREIISITTANRRMGLHTISNIISENPSFPSISHQTVANVKHKYGFDFLPPKHSFYLTDQQRQDRITFANYHLNANTDWSSVLFTDESMFVLDSNRRWLWRRRGETDPDVYYATHKYNKKVMVFGGISERYKSPFISIC